MTQNQPKKPSKSANIFHACGKGIIRIEDHLTAALIAAKETISNLKESLEHLDDQLDPPAEEKSYTKR